MKAAKEGWIKKQCNLIDTNMRKGNSKEAYATLKLLSKTSQPRASVIEDENGHLLTDSNDVLKRWTEYCMDLYNHKIQTDPSKVRPTPMDLREDSPPII